jgi:hypothetical protein
MHAVHSKGIATAQDGGHIVGIMHIVDDKGQILLALGQNFPDPLPAFFREKGGVIHGVRRDCV